MATVKHDYISREAAIDAVDVCNLHRGIIDALQAIISDIPAADVRPVVRAELKPCPFCGTTPKIDYHGMLATSHDVRVEWRIECPKCGISKSRLSIYVLKSSGMFEEIDLAYEALINEWNRREDGNETC